MLPNKNKIRRPGLSHRLTLYFMHIFGTIAAYFFFMLFYYLFKVPARIEEPELMPQEGPPAPQIPVIEDQEAEDIEAETRRQENAAKLLEVFSRLNGLEDLQTNLALAREQVKESLKK